MRFNERGRGAVRYREIDWFEPDAATRIAPPGGVSAILLFLDPGGAGTSSNDAIVIGLGTPFIDLSASNDRLTTALNIDDASHWHTGAHGLIAPQAGAWTTIASAGQGKEDWFAVTLVGNSSITLDVDFAAGGYSGPSWDAQIELTDARGTLLASNLDGAQSSGGLGSVSGADPFLTYTVARSGTYYIRVGSGSGKLQPVPSGDAYILNVQNRSHSESGGVAVQDATVSGGGGSDYIVGGAGNDQLFGATADGAAGSTSDIVYGLGGDDTITGSAAGDQLFGGVGNDVIRARGGTVDGGNSLFDTLSLELLTQGATIDMITGQAIAGAVTIQFTGTPSLTGTPFADDALVALSSTVDITSGLLPIIDMGSGDDIVHVGGSFAGTIRGGAGSDLIDLSSYAGSGQALGIDLTTGSVTGSGAGNLALDGIENVTTGASVDTILGTSAANIIRAGDGGDTIDGKGGIDTLDGGDGDDMLALEAGAADGGIGRDTLDLSQATSRVTLNVATGQATSATGAITFTNIEAVIATGFADVLSGDRGDLSAGDGNDTVIVTAAGNGRLDGGTGVDLLDASGYGSAGTALTIDLRVIASVAFATSVKNFENISTGVTDDTITGTDGDNVIRAGDGNNVIYGGAGNDTEYGGAGGDVFRETSGNDYIDGGGGIDQLIYTAAPRGVTVSLATDQPQDTGVGRITLVNVENLAGSTYNDVLSGNDGANYISTSSGGQDVLRGLGGDDILVFTGSSIGNGDGGEGIDTILLLGAGITADFGLGTATTAGRQITFSNVEILSGSNLRDVITAGARATILGNDGNDVIFGTSARATLLDGGDGLDIVVAPRDATADQGVVINLRTGTASFAASIVNFEQAQGGAGQDRIIGSDDGVILLGAGGDDRLTGGAGADSLNGQEADDVLTGGASTDHILGGEGDDTIDGGLGTDLLFGDQGVTQMFGNDIISSGGGRDFLLGQGGDDVLTASAAYGGGVLWAPDTVTRNDRAHAQSLDAFMSLASDDDILNSAVVPHATVAAMAPHAVDWYSFTVGAAGTITLDIDATRGDVKIALYSSGGVQLAYNDDSTALDSGDLTGLESFLSFAVTAPGTYYVAVGGYTDGSQPPAQFLGGEHYQLHVSVPGAVVTDTTVGGAILEGGAGDDRLVSGRGGDVLAGGDGIDTASYAGLHAVVVSLAETGRQDTRSGGPDILSGVENLIGSAFNDVLTGDGGANRLDGGAGRDRLSGGAGGDTYIVDDAGDRIIEAAVVGRDTVIASVNWRLAANFEDLTLVGAAAINGTGNTTDNVLAGNDAANVLSGGAGTDTLTGNGGNDTLNGGVGADLLSGGLGDDLYIVNEAGDVTIEAADAGTDTVKASIGWTLGANLENLLLTGGARDGTGNALANRITGSAGADTLAGLDGDDVLIGGAGRDVLTGGNGADQFRFVTGDGGATLAQADEITDFSSADHDRINLAAIDANLATPADDKFTWIGTAAFGGHAGELRVGMIGADTIVVADLNGDKAADLYFRLNGAVSLTASDFAL